MQTEPLSISLTTVGRFRWQIGALIALANTINYVDRQVLGLLSGMFIASATGFLPEYTGSYLPIFALAASVYLAALGIFHFLTKE